MPLPLPWIIGKGHGPAAGRVLLLPVDRVSGDVQLAEHLEHRFTLASAASQARQHGRLRGGLGADRHTPGPEWLHCKMYDPRTGCGLISRKIERSCPSRCSIPGPKSTVWRIFRGQYSGPKSSPEAGKPVTVEISESRSAVLRFPKALP